MKTKPLLLFIASIFGAICANAQTVTGITNANNTFVGVSAGNTTTTGIMNVSIGDNSGKLLTSGHRNSILGSLAGAALSTGWGNLLAGRAAGMALTTGNQNTILGYGSGISTTTDAFNTFVGSQAGQTTTGSGNTIIGANTNWGPTPIYPSCENCTILGYKSTVAVTGLTNAIAIGFDSRVGASNAMILGNSNVNVGIGVTAPTAKLQVAGKILISGSTASLEVNGNTTLTGTSSNLSVAGSTTLANLQVGGNTTLTGTSSNLSVAGSTTLANLQVGGNTTLTGTSSNLSVAGSTILANLQVGGNTTLTGTNSNLTVGGKTILSGPTIIGNGITVFPGITNSPNPLYNLYVSEGILAEKVAIGAKNTTQWSDFVFKKSYKLRTLKELELFINKNGHLPEIPTEKEVRSKGMDLAINDAKLLQKIEELTLYIIAQDKRIQGLENIIKTSK